MLKGAVATLEFVESESGKEHPVWSVREGWTVGFWNAEIAEDAEKTVRRFNRLRR